MELKYKHQRVTHFPPSQITTRLLSMNKILPHQKSVGKYGSIILHTVGPIEPRTTLLG